MKFNNHHSLALPCVLLAVAVSVLGLGSHCMAEEPRPIIRVGQSVVVRVVDTSAYWASPVPHPLYVNDLGGWAKDTGAKYTFERIDSRDEDTALKDGDVIRIKVERDGNAAQYMYHGAHDFIYFEKLADRREDQALRWKISKRSVGRGDPQAKYIREGDAVWFSNVSTGKVIGYEEPNLVSSFKLLRSRDGCAWGIKLVDPKPR